MSELRDAWAKIKIGLRGLDELGGMIFDWLNANLPGIMLLVFLATVVVACVIDWLGNPPLRGAP